MKVRQNPELKGLNTFGLDAKAQLLFEIESEEDILSLPVFDPSRDFLLGGGSNVVFLSDIPGSLYLNRIRGMVITNEEDGRVLVEAGAGESWDGLVRWTVDQGLCGLENLALIPGCVGAAPVQNIGAYGVELAHLVESVTAWDWRRMQWVQISRQECRFGYRDSRFKSADPDRFLITSLRLALKRQFEPHLEYAGLREELSDLKPDTLSAADVSAAVTRLRQRKLPDPARQGNAGSFFKNPEIEADRAAALLEKHPALPAWPQASGTVRLSAAWMIEACGMKGKGLGGAAVSERHALVLLNRGTATGADVAGLARHIQDAVMEKFEIELEPEPRMVKFS
jgi:UDP-N-acetylmuramate dehydrogenase